MSGTYPSINRFSSWNQDRDLPGVLSLPMHFRNNNYTTVALGKVYHYRVDAQGSWDRVWQPPLITDRFDYHSAENIQIIKERMRTRNPERGTPSALPFEKLDVPDITYFDGRIANRAIEELWNFKNTSEPFFLAVGFHKPHLPFNAPTKYWDLYDEKDIKLPPNKDFAKDAPGAARSHWGELRHYYGIPEEGPVPDTTALRLLHGYYACVSYIDAQVGKLIEALNYLGMANNTIVILWGDHGFHLDENGLWAKYNNFKRASHSPLIVKVPWKNSGLRTDALVEFVDIYPSLSGLAGLRTPYHLQGRSFVPLFNNPDKPWKEAVFYRAGNGETIVTATHAYTEWINPETGNTHARMLYDHETDPEETVNISEHSENKSLVQDLHERLHKHMMERDKISLP